MNTLKTHQQKLFYVIELAEKNIRKCPYCIQHDPRFISKYPDVEIEVSYFSSSPAFSYDHEWFHLSLSNKDQKYLGGFIWVKCQKELDQEYLAIATGKYFTFDDATNYVEEFFNNLSEKES